MPQNILRNYEKAYQDDHPKPAGARVRNGPGRLQIQCWKGMTHEIQASPDLLTWTPVATVTNLNPTGGVRRADPAAPGQPMRLYRAVKQ